MNRARWYSSSTVLLNGEVYIQGGSGGTDCPEIRATTGTFRLLTGADTSALDFMYPRNFIAPDGRVFGYDSLGKMYYVNTGGQRRRSAASGQFSGPTGSDASAAMFRPGPHPAVRRQLQRRRRDRHHERRAGGDADRIDVVAAPAGQRDGSCRRQGAGHRRQLGLERTHQRQQQRRDLGPEDRHLDRRRQRQPRAPVPLDRRADAGRQRAGGGRRRAGPAEQHQLRDLLSAVPVRRRRAPSRRAPPSQSAPSVLDIGQTFAVDFGSSQSIGRVVLVKTTAVTHSFNMEQRFVELTFTASGNRLMVQSPTRAADAPPGFYLLFVLDSAGVPSVARIVQGQRRDGAEPGGDSGPRRSRQPGRTWSVRPCRCSLRRRDPNGDALGYGASGLPAGSVDQRHHGP